MGWGQLGSDIKLSIRKKQNKKGVVYQWPSKEKGMFTRETLPAHRMSTINMNIMDRITSPTGA